MHGGRVVAHKGFFGMNESVLGVNEALVKISSGSLTRCLVLLNASLNSINNASLNSINKKQSFKREVATAWWF